MPDPILSVERCGGKTALARKNPTYPPGKLAPAKSTGTEGGANLRGGAKLTRTELFPYRESETGPGVEKTFRPKSVFLEPARIADSEYHF